MASNREAVDSLEAWEAAEEARKEAKVVCSVASSVEGATASCLDFSRVFSC